MAEAKRYTLHMRVAKKWKENLASASKLAGVSETAIVERAVDIYLDEHFDDLKEKGKQ